MTQPKFAPREIFEQILEWSVIPTFDLVLEYGSQGVIIVKRKIAPYKDMWALPGLRMYKGESINDTITRIANQELGLTIDPNKRTFIGQYVGKFQTEHQRQDLSTAYYIKLTGTEQINLNTDHFSSYDLVKKPPKNMGAMYTFYLQEYLRVARIT